MKTLIVKVIPGCEDLANAIFPRGSEWEFVSEDYDLAGNGKIEYNWNGDMQAAIERNLDCARDVISYEIQ